MTSILNLILINLTFLKGRTKENRENLDKLGGVEKLIQVLKTSGTVGLSKENVLRNRRIYGENSFPESPMASFLELFANAFTDTTFDLNF